MTERGATVVTGHMAINEENCRTVITHKGYVWHESPVLGRVQITQLLIEVFDAVGKKIGQYPVGLSEPNTVTLLGIRVKPETN